MPRRLADESTWFNHSRVRLVGAAPPSGGAWAGGGVLDGGWGEVLEGRLEVRLNGADVGSNGTDVRHHGTDVRYNDTGHVWGTVCNEVRAPSVSQ